MFYHIHPSKEECFLHLKFNLYQMVINMKKQLNGENEIK
jgi:hypothetical protein